MAKGRLKYRPPAFSIMTTIYSKGLELLEDRHIMGVILMLYATGPSIKTVIYKEVSAVGTMPRKLDRLVESGILETRVKGGRTEYSLTESGRMVASDLCRIREHILRALVMEQ